MKKLSSKPVVTNYQFVMLAFFMILLSGCAASIPKQPITSLYSPMYTPKYSYELTNEKKAPVGYTIGIINMEVTTEATPANSWVIRTPLEKQYVRNFKESFSSGLEKIILSKGLTVSGPFESYEEMTYPERSRCEFLVQPILKLVFQPSISGIRNISEYGGPGGQSWRYRMGDRNLSVTAEMSYVIYDPLTKEKLERHKLKTDPFTKSSKVLAVQYVQKDKNGNVIKETWTELDKDKDHPNYHNSEILTGLVTDELYASFMAKVDKIISVEEFNHLMKYKKELEKKKRY